MFINYSLNSLSLKSKLYTLYTTGQQNIRKSKMQVNFKHVKCTQLEQPRPRYQNNSIPGITDVCLISAYSPHSPETLSNLRHQLHVASNNVSQSAALSPNTVTGQSSPSVYFGLSRRGSLSSVAGKDRCSQTYSRKILCSRY